MSIPLSLSPGGIEVLRSVAEVPAPPVPWLELSRLMTLRLPRLEVEAGTGLSTKPLLDAIVELGTWLGLHRGAAPNTPLPPGFSRTACGRDLRRAVANCANHRLETDDLELFRPPTSVRSTPRVAPDLAQSLCTIDRLRGLGGIEDLARLPDGRLDPVFSRSIVETYDLLVETIAAVHTNVHRFETALRAPNPDRAVLRDLLERVTWLDPSYVGRLLQALSADSTDLARARSQHPSGLRTRLPHRLADLRYGQVVALFHQVELARSA